MFKPEKLVRITIQVPARFISAVTAVLAGFRLLHLIRISETHPGHWGYVSETDVDLLTEFDDFLNEIESFLKALQVPPQAVDLNGPIIPEKEIFRLRERVTEVRREVKPVSGGLADARQAMAGEKTLCEKLNFLPADIDLARLDQCRFVHWRIGLIPLQGLEKLDESLSEVHHALIHIGTLEQRAVVVAFGLRADRSVLENALKGAFFETIDIPGQEVSGTVGEMIAGIHSRMATLNRQFESLEQKREGLQKKLGAELLTLREKIITAHNILSARRFFGKIKGTHVISGWIPVRLCDTLRKELEKTTEGQLIFETVSPEDLVEVRRGIVNIPILFNNPLLIRPFEKLTGLYGTPRYREVEPTLFFALSFLLMFGMMFGDVGHGAILFAMGYFVFRRFYTYMDYGIILMECGFFAVLFGFLYGSLFGLEDVLPALWFRPMDDIPYFMKVVLGLGAVLVSLGLVLNLINSLRLKEYERLLSASGLAGALFYWLLVGAGLKYVFSGPLLQAEWSVFWGSAAILLAVMIFHRPFYRLLIAGEPFAKVIGEKGFFTGIAESAVASLDDLMRYLTHTVSFIRVAAFALAHAALFAAVFAIADLVAHAKGGTLFYWLVLIIGNGIIILLEGLVVSIQVIRLEYYEFFSKFFRGGGETFRSFDQEIRTREREL